SQSDNGLSKGGPRVALFAARSCCYPLLRRSCLKTATSGHQPLGLSTLGYAAGSTSRAIVHQADSGKSMADTADDLSTPLGQKTADTNRRFRLPFTVLQALAALLGLFLATFAGFAIFNDNPLGGEPTVRVALPAPAPDAKPAAPASTAPDTAA